MASADETPRPARPAHRTLILVIAIVGAVAVVAALTTVAYRVGVGTAAAPAPTVSPSPTATTPTTAEIYQAVGPSVVLIRTAGGSLGTGVVAAKDGTILTANHVVSGGGDITVGFADGSTSPAVVTASDAAHDIASLVPTAPTATIVPATLGGSAVVGGPVVAIGNPLGLTESVSTGVISGLDRKATTEQGPVSGLIQFDASVNPGSSGGPLLDAQGLVIGIVVALANPAGDDAFAGIGFAVPIGAALGGGRGGDGDGPQK